MNLFSTLWRLIIILLSFPIKRGPLLPAGCHRFNGPGYLTVKPAPLFEIGSNLTVYCCVPKLQAGFKISLELNGVTVAPLKKVNSTMVIFSLVNVRRPLSKLLCKLKKEQESVVAAGLDLLGGFRPDKPGNVLCEMSRSSDFINCTWERGWETHLLTTYNISLKRENGTQMLLDQTQDAEDIAIPRAKIDENTTHQLVITAYNHFGSSRSNPLLLCVKDIVIPETPRIVQVEFGNNSVAALRWETSESSENLRSDVRLRTDSGSWEAGEGTELAEGLIRVDGLRPLTGYEFKMRTCSSPTNATGSKSSKRSLCSKWSPSVAGRSPGKGPSQRMHVWRMLGTLGTDGLRMVTVLWKPPSPDDYSGAVQNYKIFLGDDQKQEVTCPAAVSRCSLQVPAELRALSISAVTLYGTSPPADVPLGHSGDFGPVLRELAPSANGSSVFVSWSSRGRGRGTSGGEPLHYVLEWTSVPVAELQWQKVAKDQNSIFIRGLTAGVRYNISLYAVTTRGISAPSSDLVYSKELKPVSGPNMSVLAHKSRRILIQWDELPVVKQKGFIKNYTIYIQTLDSSNTEQSVTVSGSGPRERWLVCPEGDLALQLTASTSAGEGQRGKRVCSQPESPAVGLVIVLVFIITLFIVIISNLMCWSCVRERIKQKCVSWGPAWLHENLPKLGNSNAIRLLKQYGSELFLSSMSSDPPLSPISLISQEKRDDVYPTVHVETPRVGSGPTAETPLLVDVLLEHVSYKPQIVMSGWEETEDEQRDAPSHGEEDFLTSAGEDFSDLPLGLSLGSVGGLLWPKAPETTIFFNEGFLLGRQGTGNEVEADSPSPDSQRGEIMSPDTEDTCLSQYTVEALTGGYFPQAAAVSSTTPCDTQR